MKKTEKIKIIYFINGVMASDKAQKEAEKFYPAQVVFRNARYIKNEDGLEPCDAVAGDVPNAYGEKYPKALNFLKSYAKNNPNKDAEVKDQKKVTKAQDSKKSKDDQVEDKPIDAEEVETSDVEKAWEK